MMQKLTSELYRSMKNFPGLFDWNIISMEIELSEDIIREFLDEVHLDKIFRFQELSEDFILQLIENRHFDWVWISLCQRLSQKFIVENLSKLDIRMLLSNKKIPQETKDYIKMFV